MFKATCRCGRLDGQIDTRLMVVMKKVLPFYIVATLCLFFALFSVLTLTGSVEPEADSENGELLIEEEAAAIVPQPQLDFPDLVFGRIYSVSHITTVVESPEGITDVVEELPAGGFFRVDDALQINDALWYRIAVNNGFEDYAMYLKAEELNWKTLEWQRTPEEQHELKTEELMATFARLGQERYPSLPAQPEPEPVIEQPITLDSVIASISSQGMFISALIAVVTTLAIVFALAFIFYYRSTHRWSDSGEFDDFTSEMGEHADEDYGERELPGADDGC